MSSDLITVGEASALLAVSTSMVRILAIQGQLLTVARVGKGGARLFLRSHVVELARQRATRAAKKAA